MQANGGKSTDGGKGEDGPTPADKAEMKKEEADKAAAKKKACPIRMNAYMVDVAVFIPVRNCLAVAAVNKNNSHRYNC